MGWELAMEDGCTFPVLIKSRQGYRNLCKLLTQVQLRVEKGQGSVRWEELAEFAEGMIALTGDDEGPLHRAWVEDGRVGVERRLRQSEPLASGEPKRAAGRLPLDEIEW